MKNSPILIVAGEPYSIFLEIFFKSIKKNNFRRPIILICSKKLLVKQMKKLKYNFKINSINKSNINMKKNKKNEINIVDVSFKFKKTFDRITNRSNIYIEECFKIAFDILKRNDCAGLINGPISKKNFLKKKFLGVTEYLAKKTQRVGKVAMLIYNSKISVSPVTTHLPLKDVHKNLTKKKIIEQVKLIKKFYNKNFNKEPKIAITGLNPHCESNYNSSEEKYIIIPAIKSLQKAKYKVSGPFAADTIFLKNNTNKYDVILGMYHDQVLAPIKTLVGFEAINITLGLPFIRISPDHGPNVDMLGKNLSNPISLEKSIKFLDN